MAKDVDWDALAGVVQNLSVLKSKLDSLDDHVSANVMAIEESMRALKLGIPLTLKLADLYDEDTDSREEQALSFQKHEGQWRFVYESSPDDACGHWFTTPFHNCSRDLRVELSEHLPALVGSAVKQLSERIAERERLIEDTSKLRAVLAKAVEKK